MDGVTQIVLGAAVGEAVAGARAGRKAALYGGLCGMIPDLDILAYPLLDEVDQIGFHRGISHSFVFALAMAPLGAWLLRRIHRNSRATFRDWALLVFLGLVTHALLDYFTLYGTQLFQPFSDYPAAMSSIFIIDPLYTLPLVVGLAGAWFLRRSPEQRRIWNLAGLSLGALYLAFTVNAKFLAESVFERSLQEQKIAYDRIFTAPSPFNSVLWMGMAEDRANDQLLIGLYSFLDEDKFVSFRAVPKNSHLIEDVLEQRPLERLMWFSRGWYRAFPPGEQDGVAHGTLVNDLRFGRSDGWLTADGAHIFAFELIEEPAGSRNFITFRRQPPNFSALRAEQFIRLWDRIRGKEAPWEIAAQDRSAPNEKN